MSQVGEVHKKMMRRMEDGFRNLLQAEARLENADLTDEGERDLIARSLSAARVCAIDALKLARWLDTGDANADA